MEMLRYMGLLNLNEKYNIRTDGRSKDSKW